MTLLPYVTGMSFARRLFSSGLLTEPELQSFETILRRKYHILPNSIYRDLRLLSTNPRANIRH